MTTPIDLRDGTEGYRERLFDALDGLDPGDALAVVADRDVDPHLVRYQIDRDRALTWEYAAPDGEPRELDVTVEGPLDGALPAIDVRDLKPQRRHEVLLEAFDELAVDEGFALVNDHDPKPLYHELRSMHGDVIGWEYASRDSGEWRVEVVRTGDSEADEGDVFARYDVREIPKPERHPTIHHRYGMVPEGGTMEIVAPHEPRPLKGEFRQRYGDSFAWSVVESEPGRCRVRITKAATAGGTGGASGGASGGGASGSADASDSGAADGDAPDSGDGGSASGSGAESLDVVDELDVRDLPPARRHERIFDAYDGLDAGTGFVLVNDHDPKPLYHQFDAEAGPEFRWEYRRRGGDEFRVLIGKAEATGDGTVGDGTAGGGVGGAAGGEPDAPF